MEKRKSLLPRPSLYYNSKPDEEKSDNPQTINSHDTSILTEKPSTDIKPSALYEELIKERARNRNNSLLISELRKNYEELKVLYKECRDKNEKLEEMLKNQMQLYDDLQSRVEIIERFYKSASRDSDSFSSSQYDDSEAEKKKKAKKYRKKDKLLSSKSKDHVHKSPSNPKLEYDTLRSKKLKKMMNLFKKKDENDVIESTDISNERRGRLEGLSLETMNKLYPKNERPMIKKRSRSSDLTELGKEEKEKIDKFIEQYKESSNIGPYSIVFGVKRGRCEEQCDCKCYKKSTSKSFSCENCGHFPYQHEEIGRLSEDEELDDYLSSESQPTSGTISESSFVVDDHWLLDYDDFEFVDLLGKGNSSTVYLGNFKNQEVAIKVLRLENNKKDIEDFKKEMEIMSSIRSPYIVHFHGATMSPKPCIVLEYCPNGSLFHYLQNPKNKIDWKIALQWMEQITKGINTLHLWKPQVVHRDLKTLNLLLDASNKVKVCDFGLSRFVSSSHDQGTLIKMRGTLAYVSPEIYYGKPFTPKSDIYSLGIVFWEILTRILTGRHRRPYGEYNFIHHDFQIIIQAATKNLRPNLPDSCPDILKELYSLCIDSDPEKRLSCNEILSYLDNVKREYEANSDSWNALVNNLCEIDVD